MHDMNTPQPLTVAEVRNFLEGLAKPKSPRDLLRRPSTRVARSVAKLGVTGYRKHALACPIANALKERFPGHRWSVLGSTVENGVFVHTPKPVRDFVVQFDSGRFDDLDQALQ